MKGMYMVLYYREKDLMDAETQWRSCMFGKGIVIAY